MSIKIKRHVITSLENWHYRVLHHVTIGYKSVMTYTLVHSEKSQHMRGQYQGKKHIHSSIHYSHHNKFSHFSHDGHVGENERISFTEKGNKIIIVYPAVMFLLNGLCLFVCLFVLFRNQNIHHTYSLGQCECLYCIVACIKSCMCTKSVTSYCNTWCKRLHTLS